MKLSGWGRFPKVETRLAEPRDVAALRDLITAGLPLIARGNGRAYGDSAIGPQQTVGMRHFNHLQAFDPETGQLVAEAGVTLADIIAAFLPLGWFPAVTPGTKYVTLGGMIAADVHGKNHHKDGSFRSCVDWVEVMGADGEVRRCGPDQQAGLFDATLGGMGLTGVVLRAAVRLRPVQTGWIRQTTISAPDLAHAMQAFEASDGATYSVAWIDCLASGAALGRSLIMLGEHARRDQLTAEAAQHPVGPPARRKRKVPFDLPGFALNRLSVRAFNALYYRKGSAAADQLVDWDSYFYPLDAILGWNRIYGRKGFVQFQCVLPLDRAEAGLTGLLGATSEAGQGSFLAVLKRFGAQESGFSFPMQGYTLALDFPVNRRTLALMDRLDAITVDHGGRFYLAKDARMSAETLRRADARAEGFAARRVQEGWSGCFRSSQSERLML